MLVLTSFVDRLFFDFGAPRHPKMVPKPSQNGARILSERVSEKCASEFADFDIFARILGNADVPQT